MAGHCTKRDATAGEIDAALARAPKSQGFAALYARARLPAPFLPAFRAALAALEANDPPRGDKISRGLCEKVIAACEARAEVGQGPMLALLWRFASEAARECAREYADGAWHFYNDNGSYNRGLWLGNTPGNVPVLNPSAVVIKMMRGCVAVFPKSSFMVTPPIASAGLAGPNFMERPLAAARTR